MIKNIIILIFALILALPACLCMYEDEIGLADWYQPHIGKINTAFFVPPRQVVVATDSNVLASLNIKTGDIMWRQVLPQGTKIDKIRYTEQDIVVVSGRRVSVWSVSDEGSLKWEEEEETDIVDVQISEQVVSILTSTSLSIRRVMSGDSIFSSPYPASSSSSLLLLSGSLYCISLKDNSFQISSVVLKPPYSLSAATSISLPFAPEKGQSVVITPEGHVAVIGGASGKHSLLVHSLKSSSRSALSYPLDAFSLTQATLRAVGEDSLVIQTPASQFLFRPSSSDPSFPFSITTLPGDVKVAISGAQVAHISASALFYSNSTGKYKSSFSTPSYSSLFLLAPSPYLLTVSNDWRVSALSLNSFFSSPSPSYVWTREEALASIVRTEVIELPPDVTELTDLVREFEGDDKSDWFVSRILAQVDQIKHSILNLAATFTGIVDTTITSTRRALTEKELITKDKFGFRKLIIAVTESGKIFGLSTDHGQIVWGKTVRPSGFSKNTFVYVTRTSAAYPPEIVVGDTNTLYKLNPLDGELVSSTPTPNLVQAILLPFLYTQSGTATHLPNTHIILIVHSSNAISLFPDTKETQEIFQREHEKIHFFLIDKATSTVTGYNFPEKNTQRVVAWNVTFGNEAIYGVASHLPHDKVYHPATVLGDRHILPKYVNRNLVAIATVSSGVSSELHVYLLDTVTGGVVYHTVHSECGGVNSKVPMVLMENSLVYTYWNVKTHKYQLSVVDLYTKEIGWKNLFFSSYTAASPVPLSLSFALPTHVNVLSHTSSARGITAKHLLLGLASDSVVSMDKRWADARRPAPATMTAQDKEENLIPYHPRLHFPPQSFVSYNKTVARLDKIVTTGASLESTTLVLAVGLDLFFTRLSPAEAYDILTSDFNYPALIFTITVLCVATFVTTRMSRRKDLLKAWK